MNPDLFGYIAATCTTASFIPQVLHSWRTKSVDGLSWGMLLTFAAGIVSWDIYGVLTWQGPVILANTVTGVLVFALVFMKLRDPRK